MTSILLIGSTGMIGSRIEAEAQGRGIDVTGVSRSGGDDRLALDVTDTDALTEAAQGSDALVLAISPPRDGSEPTAPLLAAGRSFIQAARDSGVSRVLVVGGAGSLRTSDGSQVIEQSWFPAEVRPEALAQGELLNLFRSEAGELDWSYLSPPAIIEPGERTGSYIAGVDDLVANAAGESKVSAEDFAVALVDELEAGANVRRRFTVANA